MYRDTIFNFHKINNYCIKTNTGESSFGMCLGRVQRCFEYETVLKLHT